MATIAHTEQAHQGTKVVVFNSSDRVMYCILSIVYHNRGIIPTPNSSKMKTKESVHPRMLNRQPSSLR